MDLWIFEPTRSANSTVVDDTPHKDDTPPEDDTLPPNMTDPPFANLTLVQVGNKIYGNDLFHYFGSTVAINANGTVIASGADADNVGEAEELSWVEVYSYDEPSNQWNLLGDRILAPRDAPQWGLVAPKAVALNPDATQLFLFSDKYMTGNDTGLVQIYDYVESSWMLQQALVPSNLTSRVGAVDSIEDVEMSPDGSRMTMALKRADDPQSFVVQSFDMSGLPQGAPIELSSTAYSISVAVSANAETIAVDLQTEGIHFYSFNGFYYIPKGSPIPGSSYNPKSISISGSGDLVVT